MDKSNRPIIDPEKRENVRPAALCHRLVVSPSAGIKSREGAGAGSRSNIAVRGLNATNVSLKNEGAIDDVTNAFFVRSICKMENFDTIDGSAGMSVGARYGMRANGGDIKILENETGAIIDSQRAVSATGNIGTPTSKGTISARGTAAIAVEAGSIGALTNSELIRGANLAINVSGNIETLKNEKDGEISSRSGDAIN